LSNFGQIFALKFVESNYMWVNRFRQIFISKAGGQLIRGSIYTQVYTVFLLCCNKVFTLICWLQQIVTAQ